MTIVNKSSGIGTSNTNASSGQTSSNSFQHIRKLYANDEVDDIKARQTAVEYLAEILNIVPLQGSEDLLWYDDSAGIFKEDGERVVNEKLEAGLKKYNSTYESSQILHKLQSQSSVPPKKFGSEEKLCLENGVLDVSDPGSPTLENHSPKFQCRKKLPVEYDERADCPRFEEFLEQSVKKSDIPKLQEFIGYTVFHHWAMPFQKAMMCVGQTAAGKSTLLEILTSLFGEDNISHLSLQQISNEKFALAQARNSLANICNDLDSELVQNVGLFKQLTAGDAVEVDRKYKSPISFRMTQKQIYAANRVPEIDGTDDAFYRRWVHIRFPKTIPEEERERDLIEKLESELSGILNWALEGYARLMRKEKFTDELSIDEKRELWKAHGHSVDRFMQAQAERMSESELPKDKVYSAYEQFCEANNLSVERKQTFSKYLKRGYNITTSRPEMNGERVRCYQGVYLPDEEDTTEASDSDESSWASKIITADTE